MKKYIYEDVRSLSEPAREVWICDQCSEFEKEIENLMTTRERENFTEEIYRKLRQVTKRWTSWHHKSYGNITSRQSVAELLTWEKNATILINPAIRTKNTVHQQNILVRFEDLCQKLEVLHKKFTNDILEPMCVFFWHESQTMRLENVVEGLRTLLDQWKSLLSPGVIDQSLFSEPSSKHLHTFTLKGRIFEYDAVIRLVPDVLEKASLALSVVRKWRVLYKEYCLTKQSTFPVLGKSRSRPTRSQELGILQQQSDQVQSHCNNLKNELEHCRSKCQSLEKELLFHADLCGRLECEVDSAKLACETAKERVQEAKDECLNDPELISNSQQYRQVLQQELNASKIKFCTQRIKLANARKRCVAISDQLEKARCEYENLKMEGEISQNKNQILRKRLESFRRNIKIQGGMVDSLQQQCYSLKKELDLSQANCKRTSDELIEVKTKYLGLEETLRHKEEECLKMRNELNEAIMREKIFQEENKKLKETFKAQEFSSDESSLTPVER